MRHFHVFHAGRTTASGYAARHGISNIPPTQELESLRYTALMLDRVRALLCCPVLVSSGYRCPAVNTAIGGAKNSQHMLGQALTLLRLVSALRKPWPRLLHPVTSRLTN